MKKKGFYKYKIDTIAKLQYVTDLKRPITCQWGDCKKIANYLYRNSKGEFGFFCMTHGSEIDMFSGELIEA